MNLFQTKLEFFSIFFLPFPLFFFFFFFSSLFFLLPFSFFSPFFFCFFLLFLILFLILFPFFFFFVSGSGLLFWDPKSKPTAPGLLFGPSFPIFASPPLEKTWKDVEKTRRAQNLDLRLTFRNGPRLRSGGEVHGVAGKVIAAAYGGWWGIVSKGAKGA